MTSTELEQEVKIRLRENRDLSNMLLAVEVCLFRFNAQGDRISYNVMKQFKESLYLWVREGNKWIGFQ